MANEEKSGTNFASGSVTVAALAAIGVYYFHHEAPLVDLRPTATDAKLQLQAPTYAVEARLWQDPVAAVEKSLDASGKQNPEQLCREPSGGVCKSPLTAEDRDTLVLAVDRPGRFLPGGRGAAAARAFRRFRGPRAG